MGYLVSRPGHRARMARPRVRCKPKNTTRQKEAGKKAEGGLGGATKRVEMAATATMIEKAREPPAPAPPEQREPCQGQQVKPSRYEISVPMRGMDEWALWSYLETMFGDDSNFSVVVSLPPNIPQNRRSHC